MKIVLYSSQTPRNTCLHVKLVACTRAVLYYLSPATRAPAGCDDSFETLFAFVESLRQ
jgi:hypothetical protein